MKPDPRRYLSHVRRCLTCSAARRRALMPQVRQTVDRHLQENPDATYADLVDAFGPPQSFALVVLDPVDPAEVAAAQRRRFLLPVGLLAGLAALLAVVSIFWYQKYLVSTDLNKNAIVVMGQVEYMTEEDFDEFWKEIKESEEIT